MAENKEKYGKNKYANEYPCCAIRKRISYELGWSYAETAKRMQDHGIENVTAEAVRQWVGGYSRPDINKLKDIAAVLGCSINYLFGIDELPDMTKNQIHELTGLSLIAIESLESFSHNHETAAGIDVLNFMIEEGYLWTFYEISKARNIMNDLIEYYKTFPEEERLCKRLINNIKMENEISLKSMGIMSVSGEEYLNSKLQTITKELSAYIEKFVYDGYKEYFPKADSQKKKQAIEWLIETSRNESIDADLKQL